jgi:dTDP-4-amino-4,6-dideoxygalactose transaminase
MASAMNVPFFGLDRQYARYREDFLRIADRVLSTGQVLQGKDVEILEAKLADVCGRRHAVAVGSCTDALAFAMQASGVGAGDEVLVTAMSFVASASPILRLGAVPRFVDVEPDHYMMDVSLLDRLVTARTRAVIAVHLYGQTLPMAAMASFAARHDLVLIEDAAQALGAFDGKRPAGSMGKASCISFDPTKVIGSFSSAGAVVTDDDALAKKVRMYRYHGRDPDTRTYEVLGHNCQLASEMAAMLSFKLDKLRHWEEERHRIASLYLDTLHDISDVLLPKIRSGSTHNWHKFVIRTKDRNALAAWLKERGIQTNVHYPRAIPDEPVMRALGLPAEACNVPVARSLAKEILSLPIYPDLKSDEARYVCEQVRGFFARG